MPFSNLRSVLNVYIDDKMAANSASAYTSRCDMCNYSTHRLGNYIRHTQLDAHLNLMHFHANEDLQAPLFCLKCYKSDNRFLCIIVYIPPVSCHLTRWIKIQYDLHPRQTIHMTDLHALSKDQIKNKHPLHLGHRVMLHVAEYQNTSVMWSTWKREHTQLF